MAACPAERLKDSAGAAASYCGAGRTGRGGAELKVYPRLARRLDRTAPLPPPAASVHAALQRAAAGPGSPEQVRGAVRAGGAASPLGRPPEVGGGGRCLQRRSGRPAGGRRECGPALCALGAAWAK